MKMFKLFALGVCLIGITSAFAGKQQKALSTQGWAYGKFIFWPDETEYCLEAEIDNGYYCSRAGFGQLCTVNGNTAYETWYECMEGMGLPLYRDF